MKNMKKLVSLLLTLAMVFAMSATVFAADHTYEAYQIFSGNIAEDGELTGIDWGNGVNSTALVTALKADATVGTAFKDAATATDVAAVLATFANDSAQMKAFAQVVGSNLATKAAEGTTLTIADDGYYLVKDKDNSVSGTDAYTSYIVKATAKSTLTPTPKSDVPEVIKKVKENTTTNVATSDPNMKDYTIPTDYNDVADYNIGDKVPFQIVGTLPNNYDEYTTYYYEFSDTYNKTQFELDADSVTVKVGTTDITSSFDLVVKEAGGFTLTCTNTKAVSAITKDSYIVVDYEMTLLAGCEVGAGNGNENKVKLIFSNNPNKDHDGDKGETPEDKVVVFTYDVPVKKIDGATKKELENVEFVFKNAAGKFVTVDANSKVTGWVDTKEEATTFKTGADGKFSIIGLDDGTYELVETKALPGYNAIDPITVVVDANTANTQAWDGVQSSVSSKVDLKANGTVVESAEITIENNSGATLPSTGGMGTTLIYVLGSVLVLGAGVLLVAKKRVER